MNSVIVVLDGKRATKSFDPSTTVADVFTFAALHVAHARQALDKAEYGAYVYGQRVAYSDVVATFKCSEIVFVKVEDPIKPPVDRNGPSTSSPRPALVSIPRYGDTVRRRAWSHVEKALTVRGKPQQPSAEKAFARGAHASPAAASVAGSDVVEDLSFNEVSYPIVTGSVVQWQGNSAPPEQSHAWTVYLRGHKNEDLTSILEAVEFRLHDSFANPVRRLEKPPFEVSERGWGQFTVGITIFLRHVEGPGKKVSMSHFIAFSAPPPPPGGRAKTHSIPPTGVPFTKAPDGIPPFVLVKPPVVTETADELVVRNPTVSVRDAFTQLRESTAAASTAGRGSTAAGGVSVWPEIKAHLSLPAGEAWLQRTGPEAEAAEYAELCSLRDMLANEVATTLLSVAAKKI